MNGGFVGELKNLPVWQIIGEEIEEFNSLGLKFYSKNFKHKHIPNTQVKCKTQKQNTELSIKRFLRVHHQQPATLYTISILLDQKSKVVALLVL